ncbi:MAG TPA: 16S rRNA (adenine(1518)-N(6)/adenine(1519)-N(6))-dimethyltransferase RsmA [Candidatus Sumerlaeota bacterium]|nr:16S rRNA (adenine(1518)-N(6)/adenine(1519)-N(6))-dimethyltransferase RsmA [Candidatus Sumerlaeota bacterium]HPS00393.1 16S rRNA (adenine(1518)-N(6)/adenine(1519)-N(6))-dimethyltransferase RsmA [Candidatus Sumerlaeota bacterium]
MAWGRKEKTPKRPIKPKAKGKAPAKAPSGKAPARTSGGKPKPLEKRSRRAAEVSEEKSSAATPRRMSRLSHILSTAGLALKKGLGQNFLVNQGALQKIAAAIAPDPQSLVLEIGCGLGNLTELIAPHAAGLVAVELDERFRSIHERELLPMGNVQVLYADFMKINLQEVLEETVKKTPALTHVGEALNIRIAGNIPYHLTSPILFKLIASPVEFASISLLMQREVAHRLSAAPGHRNYGILAVKILTRYVAETLFTVSPGSFLPPPKIHSALVRLTPRPGGPLIADPLERESFFAFVDAAFAQRRKFMSRSLMAASHGLLTREQVAEAQTRLGLDLNVRAEDLTPEQLLEVFQALGKPSLESNRKSYLD